MRSHTNQRLDRDVVERQIGEMWAALNSTPSGPIRDDAREQTRKIEVDLRARLATQDKALTDANTPVAPSPS